MAVRTAVPPLTYFPPTGSPATSSNSYLPPTVSSNSRGLTNTTTLLFRPPQGPPPDPRPLPEGWTQQYDPNYHTWFYVNTKPNHPVSTWTHPLGASPPGLQAIYYLSPTASSNFGLTNTRTPGPDTATLYHPPQGPPPDPRPLPEGWIQQYDPYYNTWFYVNTKPDRPVSTWTHPLGASPPPQAIYYLSPARSPTVSPNFGLTNARTPGPGTTTLYRPPQEPPPDPRPLPEGWIQQYDPNYNTWFYVNTKLNHPVSTWTHPLGALPPPNFSYDAWLYFNTKMNCPVSTWTPLGASLLPNFSWFYVNTKPVSTWTHPLGTSPPPQTIYGLYAGGFYGGRSSGHYNLPQVGGYNSPSAYYDRPPQVGQSGGGYAPPQSGGYSCYKYSSHQPGRPQPHSYNKRSSKSSRGSGFQAPDFYITSTGTREDLQVLKSSKASNKNCLETGRLPTALCRLVAPSAAYDAQERYPLPRCLPGTRQLTLDIISRWFEAGAYKVCWLHGAPGTGKSAVAQTVTETYAKRGRLAASFFFSRYDDNRNTMNRLFPTLAAQIAMGSEDRRQKLEHIFRANPSILDRINGAGHLIARLLSDPPEEVPSIIVIDGLDQCRGGVEELMNIHRLFVEYSGLPLRFLIVSRPESHIRAMFDGPSVMTEISMSISLDEVHGESQDVFKFLQSEFFRIRASTEHKETLRVASKPWPSTEILQKIAIESEGSFIYAVNVVNYVKRGGGSCVRRLDKVLDMTTSRFHKLCILGSSVHRFDPVVLKRILGFALFPNFFQGPIGVTEMQLEDLLGLPPGNVRATLRNLDPILHFELPPDGTSFRFQVDQRFKEFFLDRTLSQDYHIDCHEWLEGIFRDILRSVSQEGIRGRNTLRSSRADIVDHFLIRCFADHPDPNKLIKLVRASLEQDPWLDGKSEDSLARKDVLSTIRGILLQSEMNDSGVHDLIALLNARVPLESSADDDTASSILKEQGDESVSQRLVPNEELAPSNKESPSPESKDPVWYPKSRHVTADDALAHVYRLEPVLRAALAPTGFEGDYIIQVGFNEEMLHQGTILEEIHLLLNGTLKLPEEGIQMIFEPLFAPFPGIIYTPDETFYLPIDPPSQGIVGRRLRWEGKLRTTVDSGQGPEGTGSSPDSEKTNVSRKKTRAMDNSRKTSDGHGPDDGDSGDGPSEDEDDDKGRRGKGLREGDGGQKGTGKGRPRGPRCINIPFNSTLLTTGIDGEYRFTTRARVEIRVHEDRASRPADSEWPGPWFTASVKRLNIDSAQSPYVLSFVQTRIMASSRCRLELVHSNPTSPHSEETDTAKTTHSISRALGVELGLGLNPVLKSSISTGRTSEVERITNRWTFTYSEEQPEVIPDMESVSAAWKYAQNDLFSPRLERCNFRDDLHPKVTIGFQAIKTEVEVEVTVFWSSNRTSPESPAKRREFPIRWPWAKANKSVFFNFLYQAAVAVDLEGIPYCNSWIMPGMNTDNVKWEDLDPSNSPVPLAQIIETAEQYSESGEIDDIVSTECEVVIKTAVQGRVELTAEERTGGRMLTLQIPPQTPSQPNASFSAGRSVLPTPSPSPDRQASVQSEKDSTSHSRCDTQYESELKV